MLGPVGNQGFQQRPQQAKELKLTPRATGLGRQGHSFQASSSWSQLIAPATDYQRTMLTGSAQELLAANDKTLVTHDLAGRAD